MSDRIFAVKVIEDPGMKDLGKNERYRLRIIKGDQPFPTADVSELLAVSELKAIMKTIDSFLFELDNPVVKEGEKLE